MHLTRSLFHSRGRVLTYGGAIMTGDCPRAHGKGKPLQEKNLT